MTAVDQGALLAFLAPLRAWTVAEWQTILALAGQPAPTAPAYVPPSVDDLAYVYMGGGGETVDKAKAEESRRRKAEPAQALPDGWTEEAYPRYFLLYVGIRIGYVELNEHGWHWWVYNHDPAGSGYAATEAEARQHVIAGATQANEGA